MNIGSKVIYIEKDLPELGLINGKVYIVLGMADCGTPGHSFCIDVGLSVPEKYWGVICEVCGNIISIGDEYYLDHTGFKEIDENVLSEESALEEINSIIRSITV